jgi:hypothetical protein
MISYDPSIVVLRLSRPRRLRDDSLPHPRWLMGLRLTIAVVAFGGEQESVG